MRTLALDQAPAGLPEVGRQLWVSGIPGDAEPGDIWLLSWDARALAVVVIVTVRIDYVSCWPMTFIDDPSGPSAMIVPDSPLGSAVVIWPPVQTGIGRHLLHRRLGRLMTSQAIRAIQTAKSIDDLPFAPVTEPGPDAAAFGSELLQWFQTLCFHEWPDLAAGDVVLNSDYVHSRHLGLADVKAALATSTPRASALLRQELSPTIDEVHRLADAWRCSYDDLTVAPTDEISRELLHPTYKDDILTIAATRGMDERAARRLTRDEVGLAARSDGRIASRVAAAIERLKNGPDEPTE